MRFFYLYLSENVSLILLLVIGKSGRYLQITFLFQFLEKHNFLFEVVLFFHFFDAKSGTTNNQLNLSSDILF